MRYLPRVIQALAIWLLVLATGACWAAPLVSLELGTEAGFPLGGERKWLMLLKDCQLSNIRFRSLRPGTKIEIRNRGTEESPSYVVTGALTARNTLRLPGVEFRYGEKAAISKWVEKLKVDGMENLTAEKGPFGLTKKQLLQLHEAMTGKINFKTRGMKNVEVINQIARGLKVSVAVDPAARQALAGGEVLQDELQGLSAGTVMAITLRPQGLVLVPQKPSGQEVRLVIMGSDQVKESWPVGWPPQKNPGLLMPALFKSLSVEIDKVALSEALGAIAPRLKVPFVIDYNALARDRIDLDAVKVNVPSGRTYYKKILDQVLSQARLYCEIRVDEVNTPFIWISNFKKP